MGWGKMIMTGIVIEKILEMFILMLVGVIVYKAKVVDETISKNLSNLLLMVVTPLLILKTYQTDFNMELFQGHLQLLQSHFLCLWHLQHFCFLEKKGIISWNRSEPCIPTAVLSGYRLPMES